MQWALGPHCESLEQAPQFPPEHTSPAGHWLLLEQPVVVIPLQLPPGQALHAWYDWQKPLPDCPSQYSP